MRSFPALQLRIRQSVLSGLLLLAGSLAHAQQPDFTDDFQRADAASLGNGWVEKSAGAFSLAGGQAQKNGVGTGYRDNIAYRPAAEDALDAEASVELLVDNAGGIGYPQVFVRVQGNTAATANVLDAYILYMSGSPSQAVLGRQRGGAFVTTLATLNLAAAMNTNDRYRMRLRATGTDPVLVEAVIERQNGAGWDVLAQAAVNDSAANRIATPGAAGFGGYVEATYSYDNFSRSIFDEPPADNPTPVLAALVPVSATEGSPGFALTVNGSDFVDGATVRWNGSDRVTTFVSSSELQAQLTAADLAVAGTASITVFNPAPGGGLSNAEIFTINAVQGNPLPGTTGLAPSTAESGGQAFNLLVDGSGFVPESVVRWNGVDRQTAYVSDQRLEALITAADISVAGDNLVSVFTPAPGGGTSNAQVFSVFDPLQNPLPVLTTLNPDAVTEGDNAFTLTVFGADFIADSELLWDGAARPTTFVSGGRLDAQISAADIAAAGTVPVTVQTPGPGGGTSAALTFTIDAAPPPNNGPLHSLTAISPISAENGGPGFTMTLTGAGFTVNSGVLVGGIPVPTTFINETQLQAEIDSGLLAVGLRSAVTVQTPEATNPLTAPQTLFVVDAGELVYFDNFNRPDNPNIGNGWTEQLPTTFSIVDGAVIGPNTPGQGFNEHITYRPPAEDARDVEVGMEFVKSVSSEPLWPQVHARVQRDSVATYGSLNSYTFFYDAYFNPGQVHITPIDDFFECYIATFDLTRPVVDGDRYRLRFRVTGSNPVEMTGFMEHLNGDYWDVIGAGSVLHDQNSQPVPGGFCNSNGMIAPITETGSTGFAKWRDPSESYDNFYTIVLADGGNPTPITAGLSPQSAQAGGAGFTLTVTGSGFINGATVRWNGADRSTVYISASELRATISAADIANAGSATVGVFNPSPGGGLSNTQGFTITEPNANPLPTLTNLSPSIVTLNSSAFTLVVTGNDFVPGAVVRWNGADRVTNYVSATLVEAAIPATDLTTPGPVTVTVANPAPGGGESGSLELTILDPGSDYFDDFSRPDNAALGDGWLEKQPGAFALQNGEATKNAVSTNYRDNLVYRPPVENTLDMESSVVLRFNGGGYGYAQLLARLQTDNVADNDSATAYILYVNNTSDQVVLGRQTGGAFVQTLDDIFVSPLLNETDPFRLRLRVTGTDPVRLDAFVERQGPSGWEVIGSSTVLDSAPQRIDTPGSTGFSGYIEDGYRYDDFTRINLTP